MADTTIPEPRVLSDAVIDAMQGDRLVAAVFLSFQFSPPFFEDSILAPLCGVDGRGSPIIRRLLLEERLRELQDVLVLYDQQGLMPEGPLLQQVRAVPVSWSGGVVHAKHALLLTEGKATDGSPRSALLLLTTSANLTRTGWWQNVEVADIERMAAGTATSLRQDLLDLIAAMRRLEGSGDRQPALDRAETFVRDQLTSAPGLPRLWLGREPLARFLADNVASRGGRMELVAPFVDDAALPIARLAETLAPAETVVRFPVDRDGLGEALASWRDGVRKLPGARFGDLGLDTRLGKGSVSLRFVHAKVIRITDTTARKSWVLAGSPNLSQRGHAGWQSGAPFSNVETAILRESADAGRWLAPLTGKEPAPADVLKEPEDGLGQGLLVRVRFDWETGAAAVRLSGPPCTVDLGPSTAAAGGAARASVAVNVRDEWLPLGELATSWLHKELETGNVIAAWSGELPRANVLVEEHGLAHRRSMVAKNLTAADILRHWSLLSENQRAENLEKRLALGAEDPEAPNGAPALAYDSIGPTMFDTFSGILHGFLILKTRLRDALAAEQDAAVEAWLLGARHDSVGTLLDKVLEETDGDAVRHVVFALCTTELLALAESLRPALLADRPGPVAALRDRVARLEAAWERINDGATPAETPGTFRRWFEQWWYEQQEARA